MIRCLSLFRVASRGLAAVLAGLVLVAGAHAQGVIRQFPANIQRGVMTVTAPPEVQINGTVMRLSPGVRIRGPTCC